MLRIAICDDNNFICSEIEKHLLKYKHIYFCDLTIDIFGTGEELIKFIKNEYNFDLIFLDIELGTMDGIQVGNMIRKEFHDHISKIVFISGADGYEMSLFDVLSKQTIFLIIIASSSPSFYICKIFIKK